MNRIYVSEPTITQDDIDTVVKCMEGGWVSGISPWVRDFEHNFASFCGSKYGVAANSGSTTLLLALSAHARQMGKDELILPTFTMIACANAAFYAGYKPVFVDCSPDTWCLDVADVERKITDKTAAIMPVHIYGHPADMDPIMALAEKHNLFVLEDAAEAHGAKYHGKIAGCGMPPSAHGLIGFKLNAA